jgi:hypothetical protein
MWRRAECSPKSYALHVRRLMCLHLLKLRDYDKSFVGDKILEFEGSSQGRTELEHDRTQ